MSRVHGVELIAHSVYNRYVVIECPDDAKWDELPWEEISKAADQLGIPWEEVDDPEYEDSSECDPAGDTPKIKIVRAAVTSQLRVLDPEIESASRD
jgi:hypothetical protein